MGLPGRDAEGRGRLRDRARGRRRRPPPGPARHEGEGGEGPQPLLVRESAVEDRDRGDLPHMRGGETLDEPGPRTAAEEMDPVRVDGKIGRAACRRRGESWGGDEVSKKEG